MTGAACVYTALVGGYEHLNEQPAARGSSLDFVCLTDDETLTSETWRVVHVPPAFPADPVRSARALKILGHPEVDRYERTVWADNSVVLRRDPAFLLGSVDRMPFALPGHWERRSVQDEFGAVLDLGYDDEARVHEQMNAYLLEDPGLLAEVPHATTALVRRRCPEVAAAMRLWMDQVLRYSRRDQLSLDYVLRRTGLAATTIEVDLRDADWAAWPCTPGRSRTRGLRAPGALAVPPVEAAGELRRRELASERHLAQVTRERDLLRAEAEAWSRVQATAAAVPDAPPTDDGAPHLDALARHAEGLARELRELRASRSWCLTRPVRVLADRVRAGAHR